MSCTARCSEIGSLTSLDAPGFHTSSDAREPISLHQAVCAHMHIPWNVQLINHLLPWTKKKNHPRDCCEKNAGPSCDIMLDDARSAQGKSRGKSRMTLPAIALRWSCIIEHDITRLNSVLLAANLGDGSFFVQGSSIRVLNIQRINRSQV